MQALELEMQATVFISFFILCIAVSSFGIGHSQKAFDVVHFGAVGNGQTDDSDVQGKIIAPTTFQAWNNCHAAYWIGFVGVANLNMHGSGTIDGQGSAWWLNKQANNLDVLFAKSFLQFFSQFIKMFITKNYYKLIILLIFRQ
uniref:Uncharacterized protein n=1 Tax=Populus trichocarpa TaxID=3694 RepID=B9HA45_POPTR